MKILSALLGTIFVPSREWHRTSLSRTSLYASFQEPKSAQSQSLNQMRDAMKSLLPLSILLSAFGISRPVIADPRAASLASPAVFSYPDLRKVIQEGKVFVIKDFIDEETINGLRRDINDLVDAKSFAPSGLSNRAKGSQQGFSIRDRSVSPVTFDSVNISQSLLLVGNYIDELRLSLAAEMRRPTMADISLGHESYFSRSLAGSKLARHLDERHEETKGRKGWTTPSRRSISWLLYLCDSDWDVNINGGGLLSFPQRRKVSGGPCGSDEGNLQVGWWKINEKNTDLSSIFKKLQIDEVKNEKDDSIKNQKNDDDSDDYETVQPVFMDIWRQEYVQTNSNNENKKISKKIEMTVIPRTALYVREKNIFGLYKRVYITRNFDAKDAETGAARDNYDAEFLNYDKARDIYYDNTLSRTADDEINNSSRIQANRFLRIEDIPAWEKGKNPLGTVPHITSPLGGSLVLFDSVCLPHEVMETRKGERLVLAGWLHEEQQSVPNWMNIIS